MYGIFEFLKIVIWNILNDSFSKCCRNNLDGIWIDDGGRVVLFVDILYFV